MTDPAKKQDRVPLRLQERVNDLRSAGRQALRTGDRPAAQRAAKSLERLGAYSDAWRIISAATETEWAAVQGAEVWDGQPLAGKTLLIKNRSRHIGAQIRMARFAGVAAERANRVFALTDARLVPIFIRSFPGLAAQAEADPNPRPALDFVASDERLAQHLCPQPEDLRRAFRPLRADPQRRNQIRLEISRGRPVVGITWFSSNQAKELPVLDDWANFMRVSEWDFLSLQHADGANGVAALSSSSCGKLRRLPCIDHFADLDGHCAALAAVDVVVTISNTTAHLAGSMAVPCVVLLDDSETLAWPVSGTSTPMYPSTVLLRKRGRAWSAVFGEAKHLAHALLTGDGTEMPGRKQ